MGIGGSKLVQRATEKHTTQETGSIPSTPILTPKVYRENDQLDPRSPSRHIARTPIDLLSATADKLSTLTIETGDSHNVAIETPLKQHLILGIDPRSPTLEVQRTPIVVSAFTDQKFGKIRNKNLDKVKNSTLLNTPKAVPPKLLQSSPLTPKIKSDAYKRKSFVLLETNIDFTETDLDTVIRNKYLGRSLQNLSTSEDASYCEVIDPRSPTIDFLRAPVQICKHTEPIADNLDSENVELVNEHLVQDIDSNNLIRQSIVNIDISTTVGSDFTDHVLSAAEEELSVEESTCDEITSEIIIPITNQEEVNENNGDLGPDKEIKPVEDNADYQDNYLGDPLQIEINVKNEENINSTPTKPPRQKVALSPLPPNKIIPKSAPVSPPHIVSVTPKKSKSEPVTPPFIDLTADVQELDKKLTNLIYEDEDLVVCPRVVKMRDQSRTPLGPRNGADNRKSTQKLKVSDKPRKAEYVVSKIPIFKEKKIKVQCENTPPRGMRGTKPKKSQWDSKDDTLVI